jgi:hypothetical protein
MGIIWQDSPAEGVTKKAGGPAYQEEADELRAHPGTEGIVRQFPPEKEASARDLSNSIRNGRLVAFQPKGSFTSSSHKETVMEGKREADVVNVYATYTGEPEG